MKKTTLFLFGLLFICSAVKATDPPEDSLQLLKEQIRLIDSIEGTLHYKSGKIVLHNGLATINVPAGFKFLEPDEAEYVITELWGNPKGDKPLGLLLPADETVANLNSYAFVIEYEDIGYVKDKDADKIDYTDLLKDMKANQELANAERKKLGMETMSLVGWASTPFYDKEKKILHWAKEFSISGGEENGLNYDIRVLGRSGVLNLQAVSGINALDSVKAHINDVLAMVNFNEGHRYSDFDSKTDKVAAWTIGGLVAGKILAKAGLWAVIAKFFKFIIAGIILAGGAIWRFVSGRKKKQEEYVYEPQPAPDNTNQDTPVNP
jgi:uncharacterized membrane-anchored protein